MRADPQTFLGYAEEAQVMARDYQAPYYHSWASILVDFARGWLDPDAAVARQLADAIGAFRATGARLRLPYFLSLLARLYGRINEPEQGLAVIEEASTESLENHERWWDAELHRVRGELMLAQGADAGDVEAAFRRAIEIARGQGARSLELRAVVSLAQLRREGPGAELARQTLASVYGWFTEGFGTADLKQAECLLRGRAPG
jgi:predicted ATPase